MASGKTDAQGNYQLQGGVGSVFGMNVHFKGIDCIFKLVNLFLVYHDCLRTLPCQRKVDLKIPDKYVSRSSNVENWFEAGVSLKNPIFIYLFRQSIWNSSFPVKKQAV